MVLRCQPNPTTDVFIHSFPSVQMAVHPIDLHAHSLRQDFLSLWEFPRITQSERRCYEDLKKASRLCCMPGNKRAVLILASQRKCLKWRVGDPARLMINMMLLSRFGTRRGGYNASRDSPDVTHSFRSHFFPQNERPFFIIPLSASRSSLSRCGGFI